jgi:hypothetical protein
MRPARRSKECVRSVSDCEEERAYVVLILGIMNIQGQSVANIGCDGLVSGIQRVLALTKSHYRALQNK